MYYNHNGRNIRIPDEEIAKNMKVLDLSQEEAIQLWLEDNEYEVNEEQVALCAKAKENIKVSTLVGARAAKPKTQRERVKKDDPNKEAIISHIAEALEDIATDIQIVDNRKIITFSIGSEHFKFDLIRQRTKKGD